MNSPLGGKNAFAGRALPEKAEEMFHAPVCRKWPDWCGHPGSISAPSRGSKYPQLGRGCQETGPRRDIGCAGAEPCEEANRGSVGLQDLTPCFAGFAWHAVRIAEHDRVGKLYFYGRPPFGTSYKTRGKGRILRQDMLGQILVIYSDRCVVSDEALVGVRTCNIPETRGSDALVKRRQHSTKGVTVISTSVPLFSPDWAVQGETPGATYVKRFFY